MSNSTKKRVFARKKRVFDCTIAIVTAPVWLPVLAICALLILVLEGRPIFYVSQRQIGPGRVRPVLKFRTMHRNADKLFNRDSIPVTDTRFLNVPREAAVYTGIGRVIERLALTEIPQLLHVVTGDMSLIGSRPLPVRVMEMLREANPAASDRFLTKAGLTGPVQLVGRDHISDADRLLLEIDYCRIATSADYRIRLDLWLLYYTVAAVIGARDLLSPAAVRAHMHRLVRRPLTHRSGETERVVDDFRGAPIQVPVLGASFLRRTTKQK
jgi:lipopolysaccharide/colanic/teichoic acid biosynthesis glycosyltransferase